MSDVQVVIGAGPVGRTVAEQLAEQGRQVRLLTRSGSGPDHPLIDRRRVDASRPAELDPALAGAAAVFHCMHASAYRAGVWERELPQAEQNVLDAAGRAGAVVVFPESLYSYSTPEQPMTESSERTATGGKRGIRTRLLAARAASQTPTVTVVASDYFGPYVHNAHAGDRMMSAVLAGRTVRVLGSADTPHSFTYVPDFAAAMIAAAASPRLWNTVLHAPTGPAPTQRGLAAAFAQAAGVPAPTVKVIPGWLLRAAAPFSPDARELAEMLYQFQAPFVMDSAHSQSLLGFAPTPLAAAADATVRWWRAQASPAQGAQAPR